MEISVDEKRSSSGDMPSPMEASRKLALSDFEIGDQLGEGSFGRVVKAKLKGTGETFALKIVNKAMIVKLNKLGTVKAEKEILNSIKHPFIIELRGTFQDEENLYFCLELATRGELFYYIRKYGPCSMTAARHYAAEVICALEYLHARGIIHRDLKPENILLSENWHIKLTDFGTAKAVDENAAGQRATFVGTAQYVAPETLENNITSHHSDLWALGCVIFQLMAGKPPFEAESEYLVFQKILGLEYVFPETVSESGRDLVSSLLQKDPQKRLGATSYAELKDHPFFSGLQWDKLQDMTPPTLVKAEVDEKVKRQRSQSVIDPKEVARWSAFLLPGESILELGLVVKRRKMTSKKRTLILTDTPRLFYVAPDTMEQKGEIPWSPELWCELKNDRDIIVHVPGRNYVLECSDNRANSWASAINKLKIAANK
eukprot:ANDGO_04945.mRNA.1 3-phosphoinositide-dependent protein kinase 2